MELKVRAVESVEEKSVQEVEQELLDKHEEKFNDSSETKEENPQVKMDFVEESVVEDTPKTEEVSEEEPELVEEKPELSEEDVLSYIGKRYGKEINSLDELSAAREEAEELPEDVAAYFKYKKETGRGIEDYENYKETLVL